MTTANPSPVCAVSALRVAFQGIAGAYSDLVSRKLFPDAATLPCAAFEDVFAALQNGDADRAVVPVENSVAGRVADVHHLLPAAGVFIQAEHFEPIRHCLLALPGVSLGELREVWSHVQGVSQCRRFLRERGLVPRVHSDTAGAARDVAGWGDRTRGAIASALAARIYGLDVLAEDIADQARNTTRFLVFGRDMLLPVPDSGPVITTLIFVMRSVPAALYKALGGFATNGINLTKIESYMPEGDFCAAQFHVDAEGHPDDPAMQHALEELRFFCKTVQVLGVYPAAGFRQTS
jgi:prephenate dehydratase